MKILLLTDIPPNRELTAGIVLEQICGVLPPHSVACFAPINPDINVVVPDDLQISAYLTNKPREAHATRLPFPFGTALRFARELFAEHVLVPRLIDKAVAYGRSQQCDVVWAILQGQTMIRMARPVAERLNLPLVTHVWDPLSWWVSAHRIDRFTAARLMRQYEAAVSSSTACAVASWAMAEKITRDLGTLAMPLIASHPPSVAGTATAARRKSTHFTIGMAGQFYAAPEWDRLLRALDVLNWEIGGRRVKITALGHYVPQSNLPSSDRLEFLGWKPQDEAIKLLANCDLLYCPYPFDRSMEEVSRLSFPSKLVSYLAAGRAVLFHGPAWSSPGRYLADRGAAFIAANETVSSVVNELRRAGSDRVLAENIATRGQACFRQDFTTDRMRTVVHELIASTRIDMSQTNLTGTAEIINARIRAPRAATLRLRLPSAVGEHVAAFIWYARHRGIAFACWKVALWSRRQIMGARPIP